MIIPGNSKWRPYIHRCLWNSLSKQAANNSQIMDQWCVIIQHTWHMQRKPWLPSVGHSVTSDPACFVWFHWLGPLCFSLLMEHSAAHLTAGPIGSQVHQSGSTSELGACWPLLWIYVCMCVNVRSTCARFSVSLSMCVCVCVCVWRNNGGIIHSLLLYKHKY